MPCADDRRRSTTTTSSDLFAYLQSLPPVKNRVPAPIEPTDGDEQVVSRSGQRVRPKAWRRRSRWSRWRWRERCWRFAIEAAPAARSLVRAAPALPRPGSTRTAASATIDRAESAVLAAVSALDRRRDEAALDPAAGRRARSTRPTLRVGVPGRHEGLEGVRLRRPQGRDAVHLEGDARPMGLRDLRVERGADRCRAGARRRRAAASPRSRPASVHSIPSASTDCRACHDSNRTEILGFNALQLSTDRDPNALHGEPLAPGMVTLETLVDEGLLAPARPELVASAAAHRSPRRPTTRALLGYLAGNCGACHNRADRARAARAALEARRHGDARRRRRW